MYVKETATTGRTRRSSSRPSSALRLRAKLVRAVPPDDDSALLERMCERDTEAPGEVVVAGSGLADQLALRRLAERPYRALRRDARQGLDRLGDGRFGQ